MRTVDPVKHEKKRLEILAAAEACFAKSGFRGASIGEICKAAKVSPGHLYHYFASKEEIIRTIAELRLKAGADAMDRLAGPDALEEFLGFFCRPEPPARAATGHLVLELLAEAGRNPAIAAMIQDQARMGRDLLSNMIRRGQTAGTMDPGLEPDVAASVLLTIVIDARKAILIRNPDLPEAQVCEMIQLLVRRFLTNR
ncbi:TetR/AcrR family transcriptional regulator [Brevundimonas sp. FT23042]|uniref:TetR/AcrR family transcriptional regulator n=1 Tax=Brevundimonas sp. FT23042 TaxID=3393749 RepID=UPI003B586727